MPDFTTKQKMRSVPPVSLYFLEPVLQAEYQRFMPDFTTKFQKKMGSVPPVLLCFLEPVLQAEYQQEIASHGPTD